MGMNAYRFVGFGLTLAFIVSAGCSGSATGGDDAGSRSNDGAVPIPELSPPPGSYDDPVAVTIHIPDATRIYYTLDGTDPLENCLVYDGPIDISQTAILSYVPYFGDAPGDPRRVTYTIGAVVADGGVADDSTNGAALQAWYDYESATRQIFMDKYFGGCEPVVRCDGQLLLGDLGTNIICEDDAITDKVACEAAGHGWIEWTVATEGIGGLSIFTYNDFEHEISPGCSLTVTSGQIVGHFDAGGSGVTSTAEGESIQMTGCYNGTVEDSSEVTERLKVGGSYQISCTDPGCTGENETYLIGPGPVFTRFVAPERSCTLPYYVLQSTWTANCLKANAAGNALLTLPCNGDELERWNIVPDTASSDPDDFKITTTDGDFCMVVAPPPLLGFLEIEVEACALNSPQQRFHFTGTGNTVLIRTVAGAYADPAQVQCVGIDLFGNPNNSNVWAWNCPGRADEFAIYRDGMFPAIDPATLER